MSEPAPWVTLRLNVALKDFEACERVGAASCPAWATEMSPNTDKVEAATILPMMLKASAENLNFLVTWVIVASFETSASVFSKV